MADMEIKHWHTSTFLEVNQREYCEDQTPSNPQRTDIDIDMHDDPKKDAL